MNTTADQKKVFTEPIRSYPVEGTNLAKILSDAQHRETFHAQLKRYNPIIAALYKIGLASLFGSSRTVMLLITRGRKSGKLRSTPIGYFRIGGDIYLFSAWGKASAWYKNLAACPEDVSIQIGLRRWPVCAEVMAEPEEIRKLMEQFVVESPADAHTVLGWEPGKDRLDCADFSTVIERVLIIRFRNKA